MKKLHGMNNKCDGEWQTTLGRKVELKGYGFHLGKQCKIALCPAPANTWVVFRRVDLGHFEIPAKLEHVGHVNYATVLIKDGVMVATIEHLLAALRGCGVENVSRFCGDDPPCRHSGINGAPEIPGCDQADSL
jgi:UDP-3-O-[3-hydroxymyristoyl] N-acetylglucosamine deacetylase